jgi:hypothetical protein
MAVGQTPNTLFPGDTISSKEATIFYTIDGEVYPVIEATELTAKFEKNKETVQTIGNRLTGHKTTSMEGTGSFNRYVINSTFLQKALDFLKGGTDLYFDINCTIADSTSAAGKQTVLLTGVNLDDINILNLSSDDGVITDETDFTFEGFDLVTPFDGVSASN